MLNLAQFRAIFFILYLSVSPPDQTGSSKNSLLQAPHQNCLPSARRWCDWQDSPPNVCFDCLNHSQQWNSIDSGADSSSCFINNFRYLIKNPIQRSSSHLWIWISGSAGSSGSTSSTGTNSSGAGEGSNGKVGSPIHNAFYLNNLRSAPIPQNHIPPPYLNHNQFRPNPAAGPVSLPASVRATPTADFELYPRHLRTNSYTQATQHHFNNNSQQQFALRQLRNSDSCNSITQANSSRQQPHQLLYDKLHGRQSSSSAG